MILKVPEDVRKEFRIACLQNNSTMKNEVVKFMRDYVRKGSSKRKKS